MASLLPVKRTCGVHLVGCGVVLTYLVSKYDLLGILGCTVSFSRFFLKVFREEAATTSSGSLFQ